MLCRAVPRRTWQLSRSTRTSSGQHRRTAPSGSLTRACRKCPAASPFKQQPPLGRGASACGAAMPAPGWLCRCVDISMSQGRVHSLQLALRCVWSRPRPWACEQASGRSLCSAALQGRCVCARCPRLTATSAASAPARLASSCLQHRAAARLRVAQHATSCEEQGQVRLLAKGSQPQAGDATRTGIECCNVWVFVTCRLCTLCPTRANYARLVASFTLSLGSHPLTFLHPPHAVKAQEPKLGPPLAA